MNHINNKFIFLLLGLMAIISKSHAFQPDTITLTLEQVESRFVQQNLSVLAAKYQVDISKAQTYQSKLIPNPSIYLEQNIYNNLNGKYFDMASTGETVVQVQQLFNLARKRNKLIQLNRINEEMAESQLYDILRTLTLQLRINYNQLAVQLNILNIIQRQMNQLNKLIAAQQTQYDKGNVSLKELVRLQAVLLDLRNDWQQRNTDILNLESELKTLLYFNDLKIFVKPILSEELHRNIPDFTLQQLIDTAFQNRADYKISEQQLRYSNQYLRLQKAIAVPDMRLGYSYDKQGNFIRDYHALSLAFDLPMFNRNQGNIQQARIGVKLSENQINQKKQAVELEVLSGFINFQAADSLLQIIDKNYSNDFNKIMSGMTENYIRKNIGLVEYLDYYDSYKTALQQIYQTKLNYILRLEELNFYTGKKIITQ